jgi:hypothetical protein
MDNTKYIGMDVHKEAIAIAVLNAAGKLVMESIIETKANTILEFLKGLRGELHLTFDDPSPSRTIRKSDGCLESPIESWLASDNRCACLFPNGLASSLICDETAREIPNRHTLLCGPDHRYEGRKPEPRAYVQGLDVRTMSGRHPAAVVARPGEARLDDYASSLAILPDAVSFG